MSQYYANVPGGDAVLMVNATGANETVYLPRNYASGRRHLVRRIDSSGYTVTVAMADASDILDGTTNGTTTVGGNGEKTFLKIDPGKWESFGGGASGGVATFAGLTGDVSAVAAASAIIGLVPPSGDTTGAADAVAINLALTTRDVRLSGVYYINAPIQVPSNRVLRLDAATVNLTAGANCNILTNSDYTNGNTNIQILGNGTFDGHGIDQIRQSQAWNNVGVHWVNVDGLVVNGITIKNTHLYASLSIGVRNFRYLTTRLDQDRSVINQDGLDIGPGCSNGIIDGVTGTTGDDVFSIFAKYTTSANVVHPLYKPGGANYSASGNNTHDITIRNVAVDAGINMFRLQAADGSKLYNIRGENTKHVGTAQCRALVSFGTLASSIYYTTLPDTSGIDCRDISFTGFTGSVESLVFVDNYALNVAVRDVVLTGTWGNILAAKDSSSSVGDITNLTVEGVTSSQGLVGNVGNLLAIPSNRTWAGVAFRNFRLAAVKYLATGSGAVTNVTFENIASDAFLSATVFNATGTFTGRYQNVTSGTANISMGTPPTAPTVDRLSQDWTRPTSVNVSTNSAAAINVGTSDTWIYTLAANVTSATIASPVAGRRLTVIVVQDSTGGRTFTWPTNCKFAGNAAPTDTTLSTRTIVSFIYDGSNWRETSRATAVA